MKKHMSIRIALAMLLALALILAGCSGNKGNSTAKVYVQGAAASTVARDIAGGGFGAGDVYVNSEPITDQLEPSTQTDNPGAGTNDQLFEATVENVPETITLRVDPLPGFVFNEWKLNTWLLRRSNLGWDAYLDLLLTEAESHSENLTVSADKAQYYIATFERGAYIDLDKTGSGDGTKENPYPNFEDAISDLENRWVDEEITFKVAGSDASAVLDLGDMASIRGPYRDDNEIEELKIIGGYRSSDWEKTGRSAFKIDFSGFSRGNVEEIEISSVALPELKYDALRRSSGDDDELDDLEFSDVSVENLTVSSGVVANLVINKVNDSASTQSRGNLTFVNCVLENYVQNATYVHSMIKNGVTKELSGFLNLNNIVLTGDAEEVKGYNLYLPSDTEVNGYMLKQPTDVVSTAKSIGDEIEIEHGDFELEIDDDYLEEDIAGRERADEWHHPVSYGPYEYLDLERWDDDWFDDWDDHWDDWD